MSKAGNSATRKKKKNIAAWLMSGRGEERWQSAASHGRPKSQGQKWDKVTHAASRVIRIKGKQMPHVKQFVAKSSFFKYISESLNKIGQGIRKLQLLETQQSTEDDCQEWLQVVDDSPYVVYMKVLAFPLFLWLRNFLLWNQHIAL